MAGALQVCVFFAGTSGCGKSTYSRLLQNLVHARPDLGIAPMMCLDADAFHSKEAVAQMRRREGLSDAQRGAWLERVFAATQGVVHTGLSSVVACSLLKPEFRRQALATFPCTDHSHYPFVELEPETVIVWMDIDREELVEKVRRRETAGRHWFPTELVDSQIRAASQERNGRTFIGPVPGEEERVIVLRPSGDQTRDLLSIVDQIHALRRQPALAG